MKFPATAQTGLMETTAKKTWTSAQKALAAMEEHAKKDMGSLPPAFVPISTQEIDVKHHFVPTTTVTMAPVTKMLIL